VSSWQWWLVGQSWWANINICPRWATELVLEMRENGRHKS